MSSNDSFFLSNYLFIDKPIINKISSLSLKLDPNPGDITIIRTSGFLIIYKYKY
jgi:hypothetical protein